MSTIEQPYTPRRAQDLEAYVPRYAAASDFGSVALDGFVLMNEAESAWTDVRDKLEDRVIDQHEAIESIIDALDSAEVRLLNDNRPKAVLALLGPTGVGKSETAKVLAEALGDGQNNLIKIDCSNYSHGHEVANLIGAPAGYVGYGRPPLLGPDRVEQNNTTVLLFDEIEKAGPELFNLMLQIMGDGELQISDSENSLVRFRNTIIVMTSNLGAKNMSAMLSQDRLGFGGGQSGPIDVNKEVLEKVASREFEEFFQPEFINRLTKMVVYHPLSEDGLSKVLDTKVDIANEEYERWFGVRVTLSDGTRAHLVKKASRESHMGARPLVRAIEKEIQPVIGRMMNSSQLEEGTHVRVFHRDELPAGLTDTDKELVFTAKRDPSIKRQAIVVEEYVDKPHQNDEGEEGVDDSIDFEPYDVGELDQE